MHRRVTHQDIAAHLGLNKSTVSRALRNDAVIPIETRNRVHTVAEKLGYRPDPVLSEMAAARWQSKAAQGAVVAYIVGKRQNARNELCKGVQEEGPHFGFGVEIFIREMFASSAQLQKVLRSRGITDIIIGTVYEESLMVELDWDKFIAIQLLPGLLTLPLHSVVRDHFNLVVVAWQKAVERGYRRIGLVLLQHSSRIMDDILRRSGGHACQSYLFPHLPAIPPLAHRAFDADHAGEFVKWVEANNPDVIIGFNYWHFELYRSHFGHDIPYISLHNNPPSTLSGIHDAMETFAREAINLLNFCRRTHQWGVPEQRIDHVIEPTWVEGSSLPVKGPPVTA